MADQFISGLQSGGNIARGDRTIVQRGSNTSSIEATFDGPLLLPDLPDNPANAFLWCNASGNVVWLTSNQRELYSNASGRRIYGSDTALTGQRTLDVNTPVEYGQFNRLAFQLRLGTSGPMIYSELPVPTSGGAEYNLAPATGTTAGFVLSYRDADTFRVEASGNVPHDIYVFRAWGRYI